MNQEMKNRLLRLNPEALVEMIDAICGQMGMDFHFGQDPCDCIDNPIFYVYGGPHVGTFTVLNYDPVLHDKPKPKPKEMPDNGCGCYQDPPCRGCKEELEDSEKMIDITPTWPEMARIIAVLIESGTDAGKRAAFEELQKMADVMTTYRIQRDEAIIHANNVVRESSRLITARIPSGSCGGYWNAVDNFRRFEVKTT
jgi:hypothetical protein